MRIAIDSGGTFTDCVFVRDGKLQIIKVASRPNAPAEAIVEAVQLASALAFSHGETHDLVCGTTVGTNALLERRGGRVALVTTAGFEDVLEIGRQARAKLYDLFLQKAEPLAPSSRRFGAKERLAANGSVVQVLTPAEIRRLLRQIKKIKPDSVALCLLFSFRNPLHERRIAHELRSAGYAVSVSHEILPEFREYERTSTTVINAYLAPVMSNYLRDTIVRISALLPHQAQKKSRKNHSRNSQASVGIMQSNGGIVSAEQAAREPVRTILSGPAGGVIGAGYAAKLARLDKCISFDMGGTSTDVALLTGELRTTSEAIVAELPVAVPMLEIYTVGAGGGSIVRFDEGGSLRVGPESAGAVPGPICYGRGLHPTVTDAHAVLGHLGNAGLLGGSFALDIQRARSQMQRVGKQSGERFHTVEAFAQGIIAVANAVMEKAIRVISVERGHDPRDYTLIAFGGAGGLHACELAAALEMRAVLIPVFPGGLSALGILQANVVKELSQTILLSAEELLKESQRFRAIADRLEEQAKRVLNAEGFVPDKMRFQHTLDMRYLGQAYELNIPVSPLGSTGRNVILAFHRAHEMRYGYHHENKQVEIVNVRCRATGITEKPPSQKIASRPGTQPLLRGQIVELSSYGRTRKAALYWRDNLCAGDILSGPAIVAEYSATTLIPPDWKARVDNYGQLLLTPK
ncbi:MAG TPA: hydantoinase/oxoprolinase family protein [Verrucomicrobiae bacterium]|jgi:N-methylhydantoinase A|nr:hydantoinase/oxoprolinase family protein [Verrucomicrobiae bacterium]